MLRATKILGRNSESRLLSFWHNVCKPNKTLDISDRCLPQGRKESCLFIYLFINLSRDIDQKKKVLGRAMDSTGQIRNLWKDTLIVKFTVIDSHISKYLLNTYCVSWAKLSCLMKWILYRITATSAPSTKLLWLFNECQDNLNC